MNVDQHTYFFDVDGDDEPSMWRKSSGGFVGAEGQAVAILRRYENAEVFDLLQRLLSPANATALRRAKADAWDECLRGIHRRIEAQTSRPFEVATVSVWPLLDQYDNPYRDGGEPR